MINVYRKHGRIDETPRFVREDSDLIDFFTSDKQGYFEGVRFIEVGSEEWEKGVEDFTRKLARLDYSPDEIATKKRKAEELRTIVERRNGELIHGTTNLRGLTSNTRLDGSPFTDFISSEGLNLVCNVLPVERRVDILPYREDDGKVRRFYYDYAKPMGNGGRFYYEGDLKDALVEFGERGFSINKGRWITFSDTRQDRSLVGKDYILTGEYFTLDEI